MTRPTLPPAATLALLAALLPAPLFALAACAPPSRPLYARAASAGGTDTTRSAALSACRSEVDRVYAAQNREDLSLRDERDTPFAANYLPGVTSAGLGARYSRDRMLSSCLDNATGQRVTTPATTGANPGPTFNPATPTGIARP